MRNKGLKPILFEFIPRAKARGYTLIYKKNSVLSVSLWQKNMNDDEIILKTTHTQNNHIDDHYITQLQKFCNNDDYMYRVYALGEWASQQVGSRVYKRFTEENIITGFKFDPYLELILCVDFNVSPMKWCLVQNVRGIDYVFDEIIKEDTDTIEMANAVLNKYGNRDYLVYGDRTGMSNTTKSRTTDFQIIKTILPDAEIILRSRNPFVVDRVNAVNMRLCNENDKRYLLVSDKCEHLIKDFRRVQWLKGRREIDKSNLQLTHISDALGYYIEYKYSMKPKPEIHWSR